jgi:hypothetical protein
MPDTMTRPGLYRGRLASPAGASLGVDLRIETVTRVLSADFFRNGEYYCSLRARYVAADGTLQATSPRVIFEWQDESTVAGAVTVRAVSGEVVELSCELPESTSERYSGQISLESDFYRTLSIEVDKLDGMPWPPEFSPSDIPAGEQPADLEERPLTVAGTFREAGIDTRVVHSDGALAAAIGAATGRPGEEDRWDDREMHELMDTSYARSLSAREWWLYLLLVTRYDGGPSYDPPTGQFLTDAQGKILNDGVGTLGIIFDHSTGNITDPWTPFFEWFAANQPQHKHLFDFGRQGAFQNTRARQGAAVFWLEMQDFYGERPEWHQDRALLRTIVHELGHALNLAHSWLVNRPATTTYMNYPQRFPSGASAAERERNYWRRFDYRFDPEEIFHFHHGFLNEVVPGGRNEFMKWTSASVFRDPGAGGTRSNLSIQVRPTSEAFRFTVPVTLEVSVTNHSPREVPIGSLHAPYDDVRYLIRRPSGAIASYRAPLRKCEIVRNALAGRAARRHLASLSVGADGFTFDAPGRYEVTAVMPDPTSGTLVVARPAAFWVNYPDAEDEQVARRVFDREPGLFLYLAGGDHLAKGRDAMREVAERFPNHPFATHANLVLGLDSLSGQKHLKAGTVTPSKPREAAVYLKKALAGGNLASETRLKRTIALCEEAPEDTRQRRKDMR